MTNLAPLKANNYEENLKSESDDHKRSSDWSLSGEIKFVCVLLGEETFTQNYVFTKKITFSGLQRAIRSIRNNPYAFALLSSTSVQFSGNRLTNVHDTKFYKPTPLPIFLSFEYIHAHVYPRELSPVKERRLDRFSTAVLVWCGKRRKVL